MAVPEAPLPQKTVAVLGWTGRGKVAELRASVESILENRRRNGRIWSSGNSVLVEGPDPMGTAATLGRIPGVSWVAVGHAFPSMKEAGTTAGLLAKRYLKRGDRFAVAGEGTAGATGADLAGAVTSGILDAVRGTRVSESARLTFRAASDGSRGVVGVQVMEGPGGTTTGETWASCLVSGGVHSAVVAWCALLMGYRVRLVHVQTSEHSLLAVARIYAELSHRAGPNSLKLEVKVGGTIKLLAEHLAAVGGKAFGGFRASRDPAPIGLSKVVSAPLYLMPEEEFSRIFESLGVNADDSVADWNSTAADGFQLKEFAGWADDVSAVLDGLR
jgi:hypothetical protein